jgi:general secretion pathway protein D
MSMNTSLWRAVGTVLPWLVVLAACATEPAKTPPPESTQLDGAAPMTTGSPTQIPPGDDAATVAANSLKSPDAEIYPGNGSFLGRVPHPPKKAETAITEQGITLNFVNADIRDVAKAVLGDYLKLNYEIADSVKGTVTIQTSQPLARNKVLPVLDQTLRLNGMALVFENSVYKVVAMGDAAHESGAVSAGGETRETAGYGIEVAPVRYISATEMQKLLEPLAPSQAIVHVDTARNVLIIEGTEQERQTLLADIALFDADWLSGMSFALYTPNYMDSAELTKELTQILGGLNSPIGNIVRLVPIDRLNAVLAISPQAKYLDQLRAWVARLDRPGQGSDKHIFVYRVQHGRASDLASTLAKALFGHNAGGSATSHTASPPPIPDMTMQGSTTPSSTAPSTTSATPPASGATSSESQFSGVLPGSQESAIGPVTITADEPNNALVIVASPQQYTAIQGALAQLDVTPLQVLLEASIAEVTLTNDLQYGVQYYFQSGTQNQFVLSAGTSSAIVPSFPGFSYLFTGKNIQVVLNALSTITRVEVLSSPQLMVLNNQTATLQVGDQVPIITQQQEATVSTGAPLINTVQYQNTGVILQVTPRVNRGGEVMMDISQEVSDVTSTTTSAIDSPTIEQRKFTSTVAVQDGETVALGGLISKDKTYSIGGIPWLQEIPILGNAFRNTQNNDDRSHYAACDRQCRKGPRHHGRTAAQAAHRPAPPRE